MDVDYDFEPICPIRSSGECTYRCAWSIRVDERYHTCAIAAIAAKCAPNLSVNSKHPEKEE